MASRTDAWIKPIAGLREVVKRVRFGLRSFPIALIGLVFLACGLLIGELGFYQDDWQEVWYARSFGPSIFIPFFAGERPFNAYIHMLTYVIAGDQALNWQILALVGRWLSALAFWWLLRVLWPKQPLQAAWISFLFAVYPTFREQYAAVAFSPYFLLLALNFVSQAAMLLALRQPRYRIPFTLLALAAGALPLLSIEHLFPLEVFRPLFLWFVLSERPVSWREKVRQTLLNWLPYLLGVLAFLYWRLVVFQFPTYPPQLLYNLRENPLRALAGLALTILQDSFEVTVFAWVQTIEFLRRVNVEPLSSLALGGLVLLTALLAGLYLSRFDPRPAPESGSVDSTGWARQAVFTGLLAVFTMGWPAWFTQLDITLEVSGDRFTLVYMPGLSILAIGLLEMFVRTRLQKALIVAVLAGLAAGMHYDNALEFRRVNLDNARFFRQLSARVPGLEPGTLFLTNPLPINYNSSSQFTSALNWVYDEKPEKPDLRYMWFYIPERLGGDLPGLKPDLPVEKGYRSLMYTGSTSQALIAFYEPPGCLLVIDPEVHASLTRLPDYIRSAAPLSRLERINPQGEWAAETVEYIFGPAPEPDWCYYFEKADLARQQGRWDEVVALGEQAFARSLSPAFKQDWEYFPFIEAYAHTGDWTAALELTGRVVKGMPATGEALCAIWNRVAQEAPTGRERDDALAQVREVLACPGVE